MADVDKKVSDDRYMEVRVISARAEALGLATKAGESAEMTMERARQYAEFLLGKEAKSNGR